MSVQIQDDYITIGSHILQKSEQRLINTKSYAVVSLTSKEIALLLYLYNAGGDLVLQKDILTKLWKYNEKSESSTVKTHISRIRKKMATDPAIDYLLITERGGYRLRQTRSFTLSAYA